MKKPTLRERLALALSDVTTLTDRLSHAEARIIELQEQMVKQQRQPVPQDATVFERYGFVLKELDRREMLNQIAVKEFAQMYNRDIRREREIAVRERERLEWIVDHESEIKAMAAEAERAACLRVVTEALAEGRDPCAAIVKRGAPVKVDTRMVVIA